MIVVLGLGIGATTAIFSVIDASLLRPLPYLDPERLVAITDSQGETQTPVSYPEYLDWTRIQDIFTDVGAYFTNTEALTGEGRARSFRSPWPPRRRPTSGCRCASTRRSRRAVCISWR